jgi:ribonuclease VapC
MSALVADTSVFVSIFEREAGSEAISEKLAAADRVILPATCLVELALLRTGFEGLPEWVNAIRDERYEVGEITEPVAAQAAEAALRYGKGSGHRAQLNFGDCFSYAVAKQRGLPLLYVGRDFTHTDIQPALEP